MKYYSWTIETNKNWMNWQIDAIDELRHFSIWIALGDGERLIEIAIERNDKFDFYEIWIGGSF